MGFNHEKGGDNDEADNDEDSDAEPETRFTSVSWEISRGQSAALHMCSLNCFNAALALPNSLS